MTSELATPSVPALDRAGEVPSVSDTVDALAASVKPRMRGRLHAGAAFASVLTGAVLVVAAGLRSSAAGWSTAVYAAAILALFTISGLYHRRNWGARGEAVMKRLDHSMIFLFIAGTYTPMAVLALPAGTRTIVLTVVWAGAAAGVVLKVLAPTAPRWIGVSLYILLGWTAAFVFPQLLHGAGVAALVLIVVGGLAYTLGAVAYATRRPDPFPATFGFHEVFHACTLVAAGCHYLAIWFLLF